MLRSIAFPSATPIKFNVKLHNPFKLHHLATTILKKTFTPSNLTLTKTHNSNNTVQFATHSEISSSRTDCENLEEENGEVDDEDCPWEGAIMYKRNAAISHLEYCTTLERLGLGKVSSKLSKSRASEMGMRMVRASKDCPDGTPVLISVDVTRSKKKLRLDGIIRTVIALDCNRCGEPVGQSVYSDFSLLLCQEPIQGPEIINMGVIFGQDKSRMSELGDDDADALIELDDQLYFPVDEKMIDISKNIRDLIHVEIVINALCDPNCKGACMQCGINLNIANCICSNQEVQEKGFGPLGDLKKQMQQT